MFGREFSMLFLNMSFVMQPDQTLTQMTNGSANTASGNVGSCSTGGILKQRLRWTPELHKRFVEAVEELGGAESG